MQGPGTPIPLILSFTNPPFGFMGQILKFSEGWGLNLLTTAVVTNCHKLSALEECDLFSYDSLGQNAHAGLMGPIPRVGRAGSFWRLP